MTVFRPLTVASGRHPFQACILAGAAAAAAALLISGQRPGLLAGAPWAVSTVWLGLIVAGAVVAAAGAWWRGDVADGLAAEATGLVVFAAMASLYVVGVAAVAGWRNLASSGLMIGICVAAWLRVGQIGRDLWRLLRARRAGTTTRVTLLAEGKP